MMRVSIVGTGYVGLVTGACLAEKGHRVVCVDLDASKVEGINRGLSPIREAGLDALLQRHAGAALAATTDLAAAVAATELTLIAVGTPFDGSAIDLAQIREAARGIGAAIARKDAWHAVIVKSTVVPGTTDEVIVPILEQASGKRAGQGFGVGMNPEFLTEGEAVSDFLEPDRLVLGARDARTLAALEELYAGFPGVPVIRVRPKTAEMIKYASNTLLATLISWSNEIANLSSALGGIDAMEVAEGLLASRYLTPERGRPPAPIGAFLTPGCGFGGSCLPKDTAALIAQGRAAGAPMKVLEAVREVNQGQPARLLARFDAHFPEARNLPVAVLGLAFRPGTGDLRESPAIPVVRGLLARGARVCAYDPAVAEEMAAGHPVAAEAAFEKAVSLRPTLEEAVAGAESVILVTKWPEFLRLPDLLDAQGAQPLVVDGRRFLDKRRFARYEGIGL